MSRRFQRKLKAKWDLAFIKHLRVYYIIYWYHRKTLLSENLRIQEVTTGAFCLGIMVIYKVLSGNNVTVLMFWILYFQLKREWLKFICNTTPLLSTYSQKRSLDCHFVERAFPFSVDRSPFSVLWTTVSQQFFCSVLTEVLVLCYETQCHNSFSVLSWQKSLFCVVKHSVTKTFCFLLT